MSRDERLAWLRLIRTENVGPVTFWRLLERYHSASAALEALPELAAQGGRKRPLVVPSEAQILEEVAGFAAAGVHLVAGSEPHYPEALRAVPDAPPVLAVRGQVRLLSGPCLALVGARHASLVGQQMATRLARELSEAGYVIVSGLALGIDAAAHQAALERGTVGVVAGGADVVYPQENADLYEAMAGRGAIVSEMPLGTVPRAQHFPRRNRIIAGLSQAVLVIEAAARSGSLITVRHALDYGREVFVVPGSPVDPRSAGGNRLIRDGARLITGAEDVITDLGAAPWPASPQPPEQGALCEPMPAAIPAAAPVADISQARSRMLELLGPAPVGIDALIRASGFPPAIISQVLVELELAGRLERHGIAQVALLPEGG